MRRRLLWGIGVSLLMLVMLDVAFSLSVNEIVKNFRKKYEKTNNFSADFEQTTIVAGRKRVANGRLSFQKPNLLRQEYLDPSDPKHTTQLIVSDGQTLWSYTPLINQVTKTKLEQDESHMELLPGFGRELENIEKNYSLSIVEDKLAGKRGIHSVELIPVPAKVGAPQERDEVSDLFDVLQVWIRDEDSVPVQFMYKHRKNETTFVLSFKNIKINENIDESTFKFEVPKGVQVITVPE
jgi:outer membrane lipoprotein-sorting protein